VGKKITPTQEGMPKSGKNTQKGTQWEEKNKIEVPGIYNPKRPNGIKIRNKKTKWFLKNFLTPKN